MLKVGLTGGIGAGKSMVAKIFEVLGIPVYQADDAAKRLMETNELLIKQIKFHFSENAYLNNKINRNFLANSIFNKKEQLSLLNSIVHPFTIQDGIDWMNKQNTPYAIKEAALIFESGSQGAYDHIIGVFAPQSIRISRTIERDNTTEENVLARMDNQIDDLIKMKQCDDVLINDEKVLLTPQVLALHEKLIQLSKEKN